MEIVNNITRLLDSRKISYTAYTLPAEKRGARETARMLGVAAELVYKTIVITRLKGKPILAVNCVRREESKSTQRTHS